MTSLNDISPYEHTHLSAILERNDRRVIASNESIEHPLAYRFQRHITGSADLETTIESPAPSRPIDTSSSVFRGAPNAYEFVAWYCRNNNVAIVSTPRTFERHLSELIDTSSDAEPLKHKKRIVSRGNLVLYVRNFFPGKTDWRDA